MLLYYRHIFIFHDLTVKLWIAALTAWKGKFYWTIFITNINKTTLGYYKSIKCQPKKKTTKPTRVQLKNEIPTIITWLCTYIMVNSTAYTGYHEQKYKKWVGYKQILRGIWWKKNINLCPPIYFHKRISELIKIWLGYPLLYNICWHILEEWFTSLIFYDVDKTVTEKDKHRYQFSENRIESMVVELNYGNILIDISQTSLKSNNK